MPPVPSFSYPGPRYSTASPRLQRPIEERLAGYPARARREQQHVARVLLPAALAGALRREPQGVAELVEAFVGRWASRRCGLAEWCGLSVVVAWGRGGAGGGVRGRWVSRWRGLAGGVGHWAGGLKPWRSWWRRSWAGGLAGGVMGRWFERREELAEALVST